ncbi:MAG: hypothetical protein AAF564_18720 [Bacteroidota bacterium]
MSLVETIPELRTARLAGVTGVGYAEVIEMPGKPAACRGVIVFDDTVSQHEVVTGDAVYEGVVYRDGGETVETLSVDILMVNTDPQQEPGATFVVR